MAARAFMYCYIYRDRTCGADYYFQTSKQKLAMNYFGVDIASSMLEKAKLFSAFNLFSEKCNWEFSENWNDIYEDICNKIISKKTKLFINASYLFASDSLNEKDLAVFVNQLIDKFPFNEIMFFFQNPVNTARNIKYNTFKDQIKQLKNTQQFNETVFYNTFPNSMYEPKKEKVFFEILTNH